VIVFCHLLNDRSGSPTVLYSTLEALDAHKDGVLYIGSQGHGILDEANVHSRRYWYRRSQHRILTLFTYFASQVALYQALSQARDIPKDASIFINTLLPFAAMLWGKRTGRKVVVHVHEVSITPGLLRRLLTYCARRCADLLVYVSNDHRARLPIKGVPVCVLPNPVSPALDARVGEHTPRHNGAFNVLMLASLRGYKGVEEFMSLAQALCSRTDIAFHLVLNANPKEVNSFKKRHSDVLNVSIHPRTSDAASFYARADLVINLARVDQWIETFGLTLVEAMTFGIPVIAPPVGGPAEIVTHGQEGYCIDSRNVPALSSAVQSLADDPETYAAMARAAKLRARDFTFEAYKTTLRSALNENGVKDIQ